MWSDMTSYILFRGAYSAMKPRGLGAPRSPAAMILGVVERDRRRAGLVVKRRMGREVDCMLGSGVCRSVLKLGRGERPLW